MNSADAARAQATIATPARVAAPADGAGATSVVVVVTSLTTAVLAGARAASTPATLALASAMAAFAEAGRSELALICRAPGRGGCWVLRSRAHQVRDGRQAPSAAPPQPKRRQPKPRQRVQETQRGCRHLSRHLGSGGRCWCSVAGGLSNTHLGVRVLDGCSRLGRDDALQGARAGEAVALRGAPGPTGCVMASASWAPAHHAAPAGATAVQRHSRSDASRHSPPCSWSHRCMSWPRRSQCPQRTGTCRWRSCSRS
jgi:hypothetical protein